MIDTDPVWILLLHAVMVTGVAVFALKCMHMITHGSLKRKRRVRRGFQKVPSETVIASRSEVM